MVDDENPAGAPAVADRGPRTWAGRIGNTVVSLVLVGVFIGAGAFGIAVIHARAQAEGDRRPAPPVAVETMTVAFVPGYTKTTRFTGRIEVARQTDLSFERGGRVVTVAKDEGAAVKLGDVIARLDTETLEARRRQLVAQRRELQARRDLAKLTLDRQDRLSRKGWSPDQRRDEARAQLDQATAGIDAVSAQIAAIDIDLRKSVLKAPFDGTVADRMVDDATVVAAGTPILTLLETGRRQARIGLPPNIARTLDPDGAYTIRVNGRAFDAVMAARRPDLETGTRTVTMLFDLLGDAAAAPVGELAILPLATEVQERGAWVPVAALEERQRGLWGVLAIDTSVSPPVVRAEAVELLHVAGERAFVRGTIRDGDRILSAGIDRVVAGQRVALLQRAQ